MVFWSRIFSCLALLFVTTGLHAQRLSPAGEEALYARALGFTHKDSLKAAVRALERAVKTSVEPARTYFRIGRLNAKLERSDEAIRAFRRAIQADGELAEAHAGLGVVFLDLKNDWKGALPHLRAAVALDSTDAAAQYHLARVYVRAGRQEAKKAAARALKLDPAYAPPYLLLAELYEEERLDNVALFYYREFLEHNPEDEEAVYRFARHLAESGRGAEAQHLLVRLKDARRYAILGQILIERGNYEEGLQAFEAFIRTLPEDEQEFYRDISIVARSREAAAYRETPPERRQDFLRRFWLDKDPLKASGGLMRWCEHYRRVLYAREHYGKKYPWDRRGEIYIRYGTPDYKTTSGEVNTQVPQMVQILQTELARRLYGPDGVNHTYVGPVYPVRTDRFLNVIPKDHPDLDDLPRIGNESEYARAGMAAEDTLGFYGYKPVTIGLAGMTVRWEVWYYTKVGRGMEMVFTDEFTSGRFDYAPIPTLTMEDRNRLATIGHAELLRVTRVFTEHAPETVMRRMAGEVPEVYDLSHLEVLDFHFDAVDFRGQDGQTEVRVLMGVPTRDLYVPDAGDTALVARRVALIGQRSKQAYRVHGDLPVPLSEVGNSAIVEEFSLVVPPGDYLLALQVWRKGTKRMGVYHQEMPVESYTGEMLMLSDVQVAREVAPADSGRFVRSGFRVMPTPGRAFYKGQHVFLYFEIYNLDRDAFGQTRFEVAYTVRDANMGTLFVRALSGLGRAISGGGGEAAVTVRYEQTGSRDWEGDFVELDVGDAAPGEYEVEVAVVDQNGNARVSKTAHFRIVEGGESASSD